MKKFTLLLAAAVALALPCGALEVNVEPVRRNVVSGSFIQLKLSSDKQISSISYPVVKGARWENSYSSSGMQNINGRVTYTRVLMLAPTGEGEVTIPPFKVTAGKESAMTKEVRIRVLPRGKSEGGAEVKISDVVMGKVSFLSSAKHFWTGEEITFFCDLLVDERFQNQIQITYFPELLNTGSAVFTTWNYRNGKVRFQLPRSPEEVVENKRVFLRYRFTARCRVLTPGPFAPGASMQLSIIQQDHRSSDDDFFGGFGSSFFSSTRTVPYKLNFTPAAAVEIKPLPPMPQGSVNTSLVGKWSISGKVSSATLHQGEVAELVLSFKGRGAAEQFTAPKADFKGFRVYPPEVSRKAGEITAKYAIIPLEQGEKILKIAPAFFDTESGKWVVQPLEFKAAVMKNAALPPALPPPRTSGQEKKGESAPEADSGSARHGLFYQKALVGKRVSLTLVENNLFLILVFALGMPLAAVVLELLFRRRERELNSPELRAARMRKKAMADLAAELARKGDSPEFRSRLIPLLGESMGLSQGASAGEIAGKVTDTELCRYFDAIERSSYAPGEEHEVSLSKEGKSALLKLLKKYGLILCCFGCFLCGAADVNEKFNKGEYAQAAKQYLELAVKGNSCSPAMLYNYGNCQYHLNNLPEARYALNLASLLAPEDGEIRANLHLVNTRLFEGKGGSSSFTAMLADLRDRFRPDRFLLMGAFCWGLAWLLWSFRRKTGMSVFYSCAGAAIFLALLFWFSAFMQMKYPYSRSGIIVTAPKVELRTLPGKNSGTIDSTIAGGGTGELLRKDSSGNCLIRINGREGWCPASSIKTIFPGTLF